MKYKKPINFNIDITNLIKYPSANFFLTYSCVIGKKQVIN